MRALGKAEARIREHLDAVHPGVDHSDRDITIAPELGELGERVRAARQATSAAASAQEEAARRSREVARALREAGLTVTEAAVILGVSRGRVSQLTRGQRGLAPVSTEVLPRRV
ncbi:sigma factor-like helix-turn-helix DNA-binding protein [Leucobacter luti]|uniref:sigma factor-like helix-turn-helix DNA-binding protein n=1 Tax=Leucobacter luti TaxID=340320 RepID=UPI00102AC0AB|nr:sigma factor-like helix-turn-helix DNA-binding protein [Leucobacter luti]